MNKKYIIFIILGALGVAAATYFIADHFHKKQTEQLTSQIATLNSTLESIGEIVDCYTVKSATYAGQEITKEMIIKQSIPESLKNDTFANEEDIVGLFSKVVITPGTPITKDMVMKERLLDSTREVDITGNRWPIGLKVGDYVDLRLTYPRGEDFIVLSHKRVYNLVDQTIKVYMTEEEQALYQAALVDFYLAKNYGADLYLTKYVEPGVQKEASVFYSVPSRISAVLQKDPNIVNTAQVAVEASLRAQIDAARAKFADDDDSGSLIKAGRDDLNSKVNSDYVTNSQEEEKKAEEAKKGEDSGDSSVITDVSLGVN